ncbi:MAG: imidazole glycerol phosphate synthase subunit HisH [Phycisphaerales bacterium JB040]
MTLTDSNPDAPVRIIDTGIANTASVAAAFGRLGLASALCASPDVVRDAPAVVLPGVGAFGAGIARLRELGLVDAITERIASDRATLCVCLGMQLLGESSEETPGAVGLGVAPVAATHFPPGARTPQFGWNLVTPGSGYGLAGEGYAYFANTYRLTELPAGWSGATSDHVGPFIASMRRGNVLACQFHPELSGPWGLGLLGAWSRECAGLDASVPRIVRGAC